jgi:hypothetical protein
VKQGLVEGCWEHCAVLALLLFVLIAALQHNRDYRDNPQWRKRFLLRRTILDGVA